MKRIYLVLGLLLPLAAFGQVSGTLQSVNATTLGAAMNVNDLTVQLSANFTAASPLGAVAVANGINLPNLYNTVTGASVGSYLYVIDPGSPKGEAMQIVSQVATGKYNVKRGMSGTKQSSHITAAVVLVGVPQAFYAMDPQGTCAVNNNGLFLGTAFANLTVNLQSGAEWICSSVTNTWIPGFNNPYGDNFSPSTAVASAAGLITPSGPLFHVTGTAAITGFNLPLGFVTGSFTVVPDAIFTTTTATNIALASTAVVGKPLTFTYDWNTAKFYPSY